VLAVYLYTFQVGLSVSQEDDLTSRPPHTDAQQETRIRGRNQTESTRKRHREPRLEPGEQHPDFRGSKRDKTGLSWTVGEVRRPPLPPSEDDGYQADFTGFPGVQGKVLGLSFDSSPHFSEWLAMTPLVQCDDNVMTFTASGEGFTQLLVYREGASPISLFQLPPYCGYSVRTSWSDLEMVVPYDACYITQKNGSYVLPMLWWGSPLNLSCPVQIPAPSVFCSPHGMAVQIHGQEEDVAVLGVILNGGWGPFVSEDCAYRVQSSSRELAFFISYSSPCIARGDGRRLQLLIDDQGYVLSCPPDPQFPHFPSPPLAPGDPQVPNVPDPVDPAPTSPPPLPPQPPTQEQIAQLPDYHQYPYPGFQYPQLPQVYPPDPQHVHPPQPTPGSPPGPQSRQPQQEQHFVYPMEPNKPPYSPGEQLPLGPPQYPPGAYYPYMPFYHPEVTPAPTPAAEKTTTSPATQPPKPPESHYPQYFFQIPYYPAPTDTPATKTPTPLPPSPLTPPPSPPKQPEGPQYLVGLFYPPAFFSSYYHYGQFPFLKPGLNVQPSSSSHPTIALTSPTSLTSTKQTDSHSYPFGHFYPQNPVYFPLLTPPPPAQETPQTIPQEPHRPVVPQATCSPYIHTICSYYPYPYYPYYHPFYPSYYHPHYPPVPQYPQTPPPMTTKKPLTITTATTTTTTTTTAPTPSSAAPTPQIPRLQCLKGRMVVFLPFAHPDSIQVRDQTKTWLFLSSVSPLCGYMLQMAEGSGVILHSPQPACHSQPRTPTTISLPLRFWDLSFAKYRTLDLHCPYQTTPETPPPVTPSVSPAPPSTTKGKISPPVVPKPKVFCSSHQMTVELPCGPISEIVVKDIKGNQMALQDAPKHCGYSARKGKDGKIRLTFPLHSRCHMSGKTYIITVVYVTVNERQEAHFSCPVVIPVPGQECNLPSEQRLPCGPGSVSQPQCLSMGCCFSKHPPACYYPMDECTVDRHFVFSVSASLTEPPLSPAMLVVAGDSTCKPERVTSDYALFKIPMDGCGTRRVMVGKTIIYIVEIINKVQAISLNYGTITRDSPVRLLVECRYVPDTVLSVSYMVKTPTLGPAIHTQGVFGVQLRIAKDAQYSSYYPQYHQPLQMLLGKPLYLEVRLLNAPDPSLVLLVHFCVAYPHSGKAVWLLLYNGCPNPLDPAPQQAVLFDPRPPSPQAQTRRFTISTFQFLPDGEFKDPGEERGVKKEGGGVDIAHRLALSTKGAQEEE
ncbi:hypothetical protein L3Q82_019813, partial [Scortum barcoo]